MTVPKRGACLVGTQCGRKSVSEGKEVKGRGSEWVSEDNLHGVSKGLREACS